MSDQRPSRLLLRVGLAVAVLGLSSVVGITVGNAADSRMRDFLLRADVMATGRDVDLSTVNRLRNDAADALGDSDCSERVIRLLKRHLPNGWSVQEVTPEGIRLTEPGGPSTLRCE